MSKNETLPNYVFTKSARDKNQSENLIEKSTINSMKFNKTKEGRRLTKRYMGRSMEQDRKEATEGEFDNLMSFRKEAFDKHLHNDKEGTCCICGSHYTNYGHNAQPVENGRCCDNCQELVVLPAREKKYEARKVKFTTTKEYIKVMEETFRKTRKKIPILWDRLMSKRYILPQYRQEDYPSQEACDYMMLDFLATFTRRGSDEDQVLVNQYIGLVRALECGRPTLFLEKEFAPTLMKSPLDPNYAVEAIQWRWPSFRIYLPKGFLTIKRKGKDCSIMFLDIVRKDVNTSYDLSRDIARELKQFFGDYPEPKWHTNVGGIAVSGNLDFDSPEAGVAYAATTPFDASSIGKLIEEVGKHPLKTALESDELDHVLTNKMLVLAFKILLLLSEFEIIPDPPESVIRKPKMDGDRQLTGLYKAKFVAQSIFKLTESGAKAKGIISHTGRTIMPHWVCAHPQRICYGPKSSLRKLVWIAMYKTGKKENEKNK